MRRSEGGRRNAECGRGKCGWGSGNRKVGMRKWEWGSKKSEIRTANPKSLTPSPEPRTAQKHAARGCEHPPYRLLAKERQTFDDGCPATGYQLFVFSFVENLFCYQEAVHCGCEAGARNCLKHDFNYFLFRATNIKRSIDVDLYLKRRRSQGYHT